LATVNKVVVLFFTLSLNTVGLVTGRASVKQASK